MNQGTDIILPNIPSNRAYSSGISPGSGVSALQNQLPVATPYFVGSVHSASDRIRASSIIAPRPRMVDGALTERTSEAAILQHSWATHAMVDDRLRNQDIRFSQFATSLENEVAEKDARIRHLLSRQNELASEVKMQADELKSLRDYIKEHKARFADLESFVKTSYQANGVISAQTASMSGGYASLSALSALSSRIDDLEGRLTSEQSERRRGVEEIGQELNAFRRTVTDKIEGERKARLASEEYLERAQARIIQNFIREGEERNAKSARELVRQQTEFVEALEAEQLNRRDGERKAHESVNRIQNSISVLKESLQDYVQKIIQRIELIEKRQIKENGGLEADQTRKLDNSLNDNYGNKDNNRARTILQLSQFVDKGKRDFAVDKEPIIIQNKTRLPIHLMAPQSRYNRDALAGVSNPSSSNNKTHSVTSYKRLEDSPVSSINVHPEPSESGNENENEDEGADTINDPTNYAQQERNKRPKAEMTREPSISRLFASPATIFENASKPDVEKDNEKRK